eukprot:g7943.t1
MQQAVTNILEAHDFTERFQKELRKNGGKDVEAAAAAAARAQAEVAQMDGGRSSSGNSKSSFSDIAINITMNPDLLAFFAKLASTVATGLIDFGRITSAIFTSPMQLMQGGNVAGIIGGNLREAPEAWTRSKLIPALRLVSGVVAGEYLTPEVVQSMLPAVQNPREWIRHHNRSLDHGQKFMVYSRSPMIQYTDLFNLNRFGCFNGNDFDTKYWWHHPQIKFGVPLGEIRVTLQNDSTGELKWDALYDLQGGTFLRHDAEPISGKHAFFTPDWCPGFSEMGVGNFGQGGAPATDSAMGGGGMGGGSYNTAHAYTLTVTNLGSKPSAGLGVVGKIQFNHYPFPLLETNYSYESDIGLEEMRTRTFDIPGIPISL